MLSDSAEKVLKEITKASELSLANGGRAFWSVEPETGAWLYDFVMAKKPSLIVECGTSAGYSAIYLASAAQTYGGRVITIEKDEKMFAISQANIENAGLSSVIEQICGDAGEILRPWSAGPIDLLFLDANKGGYIAQMQAAEPFLPSGATVIADNIIDMAERLEKFRQYAFSHPQFRTKVEQIGDGLLIAERI